jgi:hypothetical protein
VLDKKGQDSKTPKKIEEPATSCKNIPAHHEVAIARGLADLEAGRMIFAADFRKEMRSKSGL